jgi:hypothetical protein
MAYISSENLVSKVLPRTWTFSSEWIKVLSIGIIEVTISCQHFKKLSSSKNEYDVKKKLVIWIVNPKAPNWFPQICYSFIYLIGFDGRIVPVSMQIL